MRRWWIWPAGLIPVAVGLGLALWLQSRGPLTPMLSAQVDLGTLALLAGMLVSSAILWRPANGSWPGAGGSAPWPPSGRLRRMRTGASSVGWSMS